MDRIMHKNDLILQQSRIGTRALFKTADLEEFVEKLSAGEFAEKKRGRPRLAI